MHLAVWTALLLTLLAPVTVALAAPPIRAKIQRQPLPRKWTHPADILPSDRGNPSAVLIEPTAPVVNLFQRADEGFGRRDWKFVIDSLQRIVDDPQNSLVPVVSNPARGRRRFESARRAAIRQIAALPPEGLRAYRLLYDGRARALLERAKRDHDAAALERVVHRFTSSSYGHDAADLLTSWCLDEGQAHRALALLDDTLLFLPDHGVDADRLALKRAAAHVMLGEARHARRILKKHAPSGESYLRAAFDVEPFIKQMAEEAGFLRGQRRKASTELSGVWQLPGGCPSRVGVMPEVSATLHRAIPWRYTFADGAARAWRPTVTDDPGDPISTPTGRLALADGLVFARTPLGCTALDAQNLSEVWSVDHPAYARDLGRRIEIGGNDWQVDFVAWSVAASSDMVFVLDREAYAAPPDPTGRIRRTRNPGRGSNVTVLSAYRAATGELAWQRGHGGIPTDAMWEVDVRGIPIDVGGALWVAAQRHRDLYLLKLDPATGVLMDSTLLGSLPTPHNHIWEDLALASDGRSIFVPTGLGTLFSVGVDDGRLLWACRYTNAVAQNRNTSPSRPRSTPVVDDGRVFMAPPDRSDLVAFSTVDGSMLWTQAIGEYGYILGARDSRIWIGGRRISCVSQREGRLIWTSGINGAPTGRAVLAGDTILVPTWDGLLSFDAKSGDQTGLEALPAREFALGNLLCSLTALYSIDPSGVRRYPDVRREYPVALARYESDPTDPAALIRLAWLELLSKTPRRTLDLLDAFAGSVNEGDQEEDQIGKVKLEALLMLAGDPSMAAAEAITLLEEAAVTARSPSDRLRSVTTLAEHLIQSERFTDAYRRLVSLGLQPEASRYVVSDSFVDLLARHELAQRLRSLAVRIPASQIAPLASFVADRVDDAVEVLYDVSTRRQAAFQLRATADLRPVGAGAVRSLLELAALCAVESRFAQAGQLLAECLRLDNELGAEHAALHRTWDAFSSYPPAISHVWPALLNAVGATSHRPTPMGRSADDTWVTDALRIVDEQHPAEPPEPAHATYMALQGRFSWKPLQVKRNDNNQQARQQLRRRAMPVPAPVIFGERIPAPLRPYVVCADSNDVLTCLSARDGTVVWRTVLRMPETFVDSPDQLPRPEFGVIDDQTMVIQGPRGLYAVGLATGKRLWARPFDTPSDAPSDEPSPVAADGWVAAMIAPGRMACISLYDGASRWERDLRGEPVHEIRLVALSDAGKTDAASQAQSQAPRRTHRILTLDAKKQRLHVIDAADGRLLRRAIFRQPDLDATLVDIVATGGVVCGPEASAMNDVVVAYELQDGSRSWEMTLPKPLAQLFVPADGVVGVALLGGDIYLVDSASGEIIAEHNLPNVGRVVEGFFHDDMLVLRHGPSPVDPLLLTALDLRTGERIWSRHSLAPLARVDFPLHPVGDVLPVAMHTRAKRGSGVGLVTIDLKTGEYVDKMATIISAAERLKTRIGIRVWPRMIVVDTPTAVYPFQFMPIDAPPAGDS